MRQEGEGPLAPTLHHPVPLTTAPLRQVVTLTNRQPRPITITRQVLHQRIHIRIITHPLTRRQQLLQQLIRHQLLHMLRPQQLTRPQLQHM